MAALGRSGRVRPQNPRAVSPWPFVGMVLMACAFFLYAASGLVAMDLTAKLGRLGLNAHAHTEHDAAVVSACLLGPADLAIGISHTGENRGTVDPLRMARSTGARFCGTAP